MANSGALEDRSPANIARILSHSRLFYGMPSASLIDLISHSRVEDLHPNRNQVRRVPANELRVVLQGDLQLLAENRTLGKGNFFGEGALMDLALYRDLDSVRVDSRTGCTLLVTKTPDLVHWMERHPHLQARLYQHLSQELFNKTA
jgi:CRP-like cAMP-binding protein